MYAVLSVLIGFLGVAFLLYRSNVSTANASSSPASLTVPRSNAEKGTVKQPVNDSHQDNRWSNVPLVHTDFIQVEAMIVLVFLIGRRFQVEMWR